MSSRFSALQRAEIAEMLAQYETDAATLSGFSALQRAEIAEILRIAHPQRRRVRFSALQRAEIAEIDPVPAHQQALGQRFQCSSTSRNC